MSQAIPVSPVQTAVNRNDEHESKASNIIRKYTLASTAAGMIPVLGVDVAASATSQVFMIRELATLYNIPHEGKIQQIAVTSAMGSAVARAATFAVTSFLPGAGGASALANAAVSGIYTATVGEFYKLHFRDGGTLDDVNIGDLSNYFIEEFKRGDINMSTFTNPSKLVSYLF